MSMNADHTYIKAKLKGLQMIFGTNGVRYYSDDSFMVTFGGRLDMYSRCHNDLRYWAGPIYRPTPMGRMVIPLFITDDFGKLVQVGRK